jgi:hypothetical protein
MDEVEKERREFRSKQLDQLWKLIEGWYDRTVKFAGLLLLGNAISMSAYFATFKELDKLPKMQVLWPIIILFGIGAYAALNALMMARMYYDEQASKIRFIVATDFVETSVVDYLETAAQDSVFHGWRGRIVEFSNRLSLLAIASGITLFAVYIARLAYALPKP